MHVNNMNYQAIVTDFNNHRLLVIKENFCSAQVYFLASLETISKCLFEVSGLRGNQGWRVHST